MRHKGTLLVYGQEKRRQQARKKRELLLWLLYTVAAVFFAFYAVNVFGERIRAIGSSMEPQISGGDSVFVNRLSYRVFSVGSNDVIAFYPGGNESVHPYIKRVAGMPGDTLQIENGILLINGFPAAGQINDDLFEDAGVLETPLMLGEHEYFVLGDNHNNSEDSRNAGIGVVRSEYIIGKVWLVLDADSGRIGIVK